MTHSISAPVITSSAGARMVSPSYLPEEVYGRSNVVGHLFQSEGDELDGLTEALEGVRDAVIAANIPEWALSYWEYELALPRSVSAVTVEDRRARIEAAIMLHRLPATNSNIAQMISAWEFGRAKVVEDPAAYAVLVLFYDPHGVPRDINIILLFIRDIVPAHLELFFAFVGGITWADLDGLNYTWSDIDALNVQWRRFGIV